MRKDRLLEGAEFLGTDGESRLRKMLEVEPLARRLAERMGAAAGMPVAVFDTETMAMYAGTLPLEDITGADYFLKTGLHPHLYHTDPFLILNTRIPVGNPEGAPGHYWVGHSPVGPSVEAWERSESGIHVPLPYDGVKIYTGQQALLFLQGRPLPKGLIRP